MPGNIPSPQYLDGNFTIDCPNGSRVIWDILQVCTEDPRDIASVALGLFSAICFMLSAFPQCYRSCKAGNMDQALSFLFLLGWLGGDSCNLIGAFLAQQLPLQTYTAVYYVIVDVVMVSMYCYYKMKNQSRQDGTAVNVVVMFVMLGAAGYLVPGNNLVSPIGEMPKFNKRSLLAIPHSSANQIFTVKEIIGFVIGSFSSVFYLASRLPQLCRNMKRKSTEGISPLLFALMILGNLTYGLCVLLKLPRKGQTEANYVVHHLPWLVGSLGTMALDVMILLQFFMYKTQKSERELLIPKAPQRSLH
ncbi:lysosomal amino acid transporter 1 homolog [Pristis pectinata]|uniref:lysosomal amino acid transporter 1 homolog n=1 Tax=Pristis pectinata TaxID=685728 RepID=UPI00223E3F59|nr:lysosomal amino acid transporter 1 homolog [Pristis pectinata]